MLLIYSNTQGRTNQSSCWFQPVCESHWESSSNFYRFLWLKNNQICLGMYVSDSTKFWNIDKYQNIVILQCRNIWNILQWWEGIAKLSGIWNVTELQYIFLELSFNEKWRDLEIYDVGKTSIFKSCLKQPYGARNLHFCRISSHEQHPKPAKSHCTLVPKRIYILWRILFCSSLRWESLL